MLSNISIKEVTTKKDLRDFVKFPYKLYAHNPYWIPQIDNDEIKNISKDSNPAFDFCDAKYWLAMKDGEIVCRIGGIINRRYNEKVGKNCARFSQVDFTEDPSVLEVDEATTAKRNLLANAAALLLFNATSELV